MNTSTIVCKSCKKLVVKTPDNTCANKSCQAYKWGYDDNTLAQDKTLKSNNHLIICASCLSIVAKTPNGICISCHTHNWGYPESQLNNPSALIQSGDSLQLVLSKRSSAPNTQQLSGKAIVIEASNISKVVNEGKKIILQPMSLSIEEGDFVALMGPSGCGKTTLLKCLNAVSPPTDGTVLIKGENIVTNYEKLKRSIGYVPQEDIVHGDLTVEQTLFYASKLRMPDEVSKEEIQKRISEVLESLNINDTKIRATKVKDLSGGQRKRISIAVELLNKPSVLFLDEPTSPLDPETIEEFLKCIQDLSRKNKTTVIMVTHKPDDLNYVDKVVFLGAKGYLLYYGSQKNFLNYFQKNSIIQVYSLFGRDENVIKAWAEKYEKNPIKVNRNKKTPPIKIDRKENPFLQWIWLTLRYAHIKINNVTNVGWLLLQPLFVALMLGFIFKNLEISIVFLTAISAIWFGVNNSATQIVEELPIYQRERMFNLKIIPYIFSKISVLSVIGFIQVLIFVTCIKIRFNNDSVQIENYSEVVLFVFLVYVAAILLGLLFSAAINNKETVLTIMPLSLIPQIVFAGVIAGINDQFKNLVSYIWLGRWATQGLSHVQKEVSGTIMIPDKEKMGELVSKDTTMKAMDRLRLYEYLKDTSEIEGHWSYSLQSNMIVIASMIAFSILLVSYFLRQKDSIQIKNK